MDIKVTVNESVLRNQLLGISKQVPYATATAINRTSEHVQRDIRGHMAKEFVIRRKPFMERSVKIKPFASKTSLTATVSIDPPAGRDVWSQHEQGGPKRAKTGNIAIPLKAVRKDVKVVVPKAKRPRNLKNSFVKESKDGRSKVIMIKKGRGKKATVEAAYMLVPMVRLQPRLKFYSTAEATVKREWAKQFQAAFAHAIKTAK